MAESVASIIKKQIGVWSLAEVGARGFMQDADSLYFTAKPRHRLVSVKITLTPADTYTVTVQDKKKFSTMYEAVDVYNDQLSDIIRELPRNV